MKKAQAGRDQQQQLGQFMTPLTLARTLVATYPPTKTDILLEPSFGTGNFLIAVVEYMVQHYQLTPQHILEHHIWGWELDPELYEATLQRLQQYFQLTNPPPNLFLADFLLSSIPNNFTYIIGNPPFGATLTNQHEKLLGRWQGWKIKKESYAHFICHSLNHLQANGKLLFILSDTFLTLRTHEGLRRRLLTGANEITKLDYFSPETNYGMVVLHHQSEMDPKVKLAEVEIDASLNPYQTWVDNRSWLPYLTGSKLSDYIVSSGGLTTGKNEYFVRVLNPTDNNFEEKYTFQYDEQEHVQVTELTSKENLTWPHVDYRLYNVAQNQSWYAPPTKIIYWAEEGRAVLTYKKQGPAYLRGVGGRHYFGCEGLTWPLISNRIQARYLPSGYILDNSSPIAILKPGVENWRLWFILAWLNSDLANQIFKGVINHTRNIQGRQIEQLPYPHWLAIDQQQHIAQVTQTYVSNLINQNETGPEPKFDWYR